MKDFGNRFRGRYNKLLSSPEFKRSTYVRRTTGILILPFIFAAIIAAYLIEKFLGISSYTACSFTGVIAIACAVLIAERKANRKFGRK